MQKKRKNRGQGLKKTAQASPFLILSLIGLLIFSIFPAITSLFLSLTDWNGIDNLNSNIFLNEHFIGFDNYKNILTGEEFYRVLGHTLYFIVLYIPLMLAASLGIAWLLNKDYKGVGLFRVISYIPVLTSWVAASLIWKWVLSPKFGLETPIA